MTATITESEVKEFMDSLFEWEYCAECLGDAQHHTACVTPMGTLFARCDFPFTADDSPHATIAEFHTTNGNTDIFKLAGRV